MELGVKKENFDTLYEVIHAWADEKLLLRLGVKAVSIKKEEINETQKKRKVKTIKKSKKEQKRIEEEKARCLSFASKYIKGETKFPQGKVNEDLQHVFGKLAASAGYLQEAEDKEEYFISSLLLLNPWDYQEFIKPGKADTPYLFSYLEDISMKKPEFIQRFSEKQELEHYFAGNRDAIYQGAEYIEELGPETLIDKVFHASFIITDSYVVMELALEFKRDFLFLCGGMKEGKAALLLQQIGFLEHFVYDTEEKKVYEAKKSAASKYIKLGKIKNKVRTQLLNIFPESSEEQLAQLDCPTNILKSECYGCLACKEVCPKAAITMKQDKEGFLYPFVNIEKCIRCGLCEKVCIRNRQAYLSYEAEYPKAACAVHNKEEVRMGSSSGAVFPELAKYAIEQKKGVVVGVKFDEQMNPVSDIAKTMEEVRAFYGSKYVKSSFDGMFPKIKKLLEEGIFVLYSGLPCECAGLRSYLRKEYKNLLICEILCHSVPSPKIFRLYLNYLQKKRKKKIVDMSFRNKEDGRQKIKFVFENGGVIKVLTRKNNYFRAFYNDYIIRPSCSKCTFVYNHRAGDITLGDFWGVAKVYPELKEYLGTSIVLINNKKGEEVAEQIKEQFIWKNITFKQAFMGNHKKAGEPKAERKEVFNKVHKVPINDLLEQYNDLINPKEEIEKKKDFEEKKEEVEKKQNFIEEKEGTEESRNFSEKMEENETL